MKTLTQNPIKYVLNIDSDPFQHNANEYFANRGATIIAHKNIKETSAFTQLTFETELSIDLKDENIVLLHTPAHTEHSMIVYLKKNKVIFMGDAFRNDWLMYSGPNGSEALIKGLDLAIQLSDKDTRFVPGNRSSVPYSDIDGVIKAKDIYRQFSRRVKYLHQKGVTEEDIVADDKINRIILRLERFKDFKKYTKYYVKEILENG